MNFGGFGGFGGFEDFDMGFSNQQRKSNKNGGFAMGGFTFERAEEIFRNFFNDKYPLVQNYSLK